MAKKILLADDSVTIQEVVQMTFGGEDFTVTAVSTVDQALARAKEIEPDLVIADLSMPGKNGYDLSRALRDAGQKVPVLILHGSAAPYDAARGAAAGVSDEIVKPFESQALIDKAKELTSVARVSDRARVQVESLAPPIESDVGIEVPAPAAPLPAVPVPKAPPAPSPPAARPAAPPPVARPAAPATPSAPRAEAAPPRPASAAAPPPVPAVPPSQPAAAAPRAPAAPAMPKAPAAPAMPRAPAAPAMPKAEPWRPAPAAAAGRPAAPAEIVIEAEPPPPSAAREVLPSFDVVFEVEPGRAERPGATLLGTTPPLPQPPDGLPLPARVGEAVVASSDVAGLRAEIARLQQRIEQLEKGLGALSGRAPGSPTQEREVLEKVAWEVVPALAETIIREELDRLVERRG